MGLHLDVLPPSLFPAGPARPRQTEHVGGARGLGRWVAGCEGTPLIPGGEGWRYFAAQSESERHARLAALLELLSRLNKIISVRLLYELWIAVQNHFMG